jgi:hypothetical protein
VGDVGVAALDKHFPTTCSLRASSWSFRSSSTRDETAERPTPVHDSGGRSTAFLELGDEIHKVVQLDVTG